MNVNSFSQKIKKISTLKKCMTNKHFEKCF